MTRRRPEGVRTGTTRFLLLVGVVQLLLTACDQGRAVVLVEAGVMPGTWVTIPPTGTPPLTFTMGSPTSEPCGDDTEDQHQVTLTRKFEITAHEVTQGEFQGLMDYNPSDFASCGRSCPVEQVNWHEAAAYCNALSAKAGLARCYTCSGTGPSVTCSEATSYSGGKIYDCPGYRLPTEAEWEHAYRAGTTTAYYSGTSDSTKCSYFDWRLDVNADKIGWYFANSKNTTHPVGQKQANAWGLHDMAGNVWEWCHDWYTENLGFSAVTDPWGSPSKVRVVRGGSYFHPAGCMRAAQRKAGSPENGSHIIGFRCARTK